MSIDNGEQDEFEAAVSRLPPRFREAVGDLTMNLLVAAVEADKEITYLKAELELKDEKLSEYENGIPIEKAKEGRKWILAKFKDDLSHVTFAEQFEGRWMVIRHGGFAEDGYDFGWGFVGHGGFSDECFEKLLSLPSQNSQTQEGS